MPIERYAAVVKRDNKGKIMHIFAVLPTVEAAHACAENANQWYGEGHPLYPLEVYRDVLLNPPPFPVIS